MWLSPAVLELHQITWDDPASLLEKIVAYEVLSSLVTLIPFVITFAYLFKTFHRLCIQSAILLILKEGWELVDVVLGTYTLQYQVYSSPPPCAVVWLLLFRYKNYLILPLKNLKTSQFGNLSTLVVMYLLGKFSIGCLHGDYMIIKIMKDLRSMFDVCVNP